MTLTARRFGARLTALRDARGWSQASLATKAGMARGYVNRLEAGRQDPSLSTLVALARALSVPLAELVTARRRSYG
jgi:transcriptional regulator with XRE-family HTH domain